jgi:hypothetical protein
MQGGISAARFEFLKTFFPQPVSELRLHDTRSRSPDGRVKQKRGVLDELYQE